MEPAKGPGNTPARAKAGKKRSVVLSGRPYFAVIAGLALAASLAVLALVLLGPVPPIPSDRLLPAINVVDSRHTAAAASRPQQVRENNVHTEKEGAATAMLPFEEHLPGVDAPANGSQMRARVAQGESVATPASEIPDTASPASPSPGPTPSQQAEPAVETNKGPRMVVVIDDMGDRPAMAKNLMELPFPVTLAILPHRPHTRTIDAMAAARGNEIILHQPMQPISYPRVNPGPGALFTDMDARRIQAILAENIAEVPHIIGVNNHMGSAFTSYQAGMEAVMPILKAKGLFFMDSVTSPTSEASEAARKAGVHFYRRAVFLDNVRNTRAILGQLKTAERHALKHGRAIAIGHPYGETYEALKIWAKERDPHVAIVTLTALGPEF